MPLADRPQAGIVLAHSSSGIEREDQRLAFVSVGQAAERIFHVLAAVAEGAPKREHRHASAVMLEGIQKRDVLGEPHAHNILRFSTIPNKPECFVITNS